jgi:NTE family protein
VDAVTASTAMPGLAPTHAIHGARSINGGVRSGENADLASGSANVVVLPPLGGRTGPLPEGPFEGLRREPEWGTDLASQVEALRDQGSRVAVITPDADSRAAMGTNPMDLATRRPTARAGFAQGRQEAARLTLLCRLLHHLLGRVQARESRRPRQSDPPLSAAASGSGRPRDEGVIPRRRRP